MVDNPIIYITFTEQMRDKPTQCKINIMARQTVEVKKLVEKANLMLANKESDIITKGYKDGLCSMLEIALHLAGSYKGFMFINNDDSEINTFGYVSRKYFI